MKSLFEDGEYESLRGRVESLAPDTPPQWGKMNAAQACAHVAAALEAATGHRPLSRPFIAKLIGWMFRGFMLGEKPFPRESQTHPDLRFNDERAFETEHRRLLTAMKDFMAAGPEGVAKYEHAMIGRMTGDEWGRLQHKHIEHHLQQFGL
ncbi:MAG: DUF1569 domain-containing protein [Planctomycetota bacterium]|jgi:murein endopeptidase